MSVMTEGSIAAEVRLVRARRRHRLFAVPSGLLLFVCMFLPTVESCGEPVYPYEVWPACLPYVIGLAVAVRALVDRPLRAATLRSARALANVAIAVWVVSTAWFAAWAFDGDGLIGASLAMACSAWLAVGAVVRRWDLRAAAIGEGASLPRAQVGALRSRLDPAEVMLLVAMVLTYAGALTWWPSEVAPREVAANEVDLPRC